MTPNGRYALSGSGDRTLKVWELSTGMSPITFHCDAPFLSVAVAPDGRTVIAGDQSGHVHFRSLELYEVLTECLKLLESEGH